MATHTVELTGLDVDFLREALDVLLETRDLIMDVLDQVEPDDDED